MTFYVGPMESICIWRTAVHDTAKSSNEMIESDSLYHWNYKGSIISALQPMVVHDTSYSAHKHTNTTSLAFVNLSTGTGITRQGWLNTETRFQANLFPYHMQWKGVSVTPSTQIKSTSRVVPSQIILSLTKFIEKH